VGVKLVLTKGDIAMPMQSDTDRFEARDAMILFELAEKAVQANSFSQTGLVNG
jgi:hypothetical protein